MNPYKKTNMVEFANNVIDAVHGSLSIEDIFVPVNRPSSWSEAIAEAKRPEEGAIKIAAEQKTVRLRCVYPDPDDGSSYSWIKVDDEKITDKLKEFEDSYGGSK
jgi:hypothetical protein